MHLIYISIENPESFKVMTLLAAILSKHVWLFWRWVAFSGPRDNQH
jgi:hypothetical protein